MPEQDSDIKARVIKITSEQAQPKATEAVNKEPTNPLTQEQKDFINWCRKYLSVSKYHGLDAAEMGKLVDALGLRPVAFLNELTKVQVGTNTELRGDWSLVLSAFQTLKTYHPFQGIKDVLYKNHQEATYQQIFYFSEQDPLTFNILLGAQAQELSRTNYEIPDYKLKDFGKFQTTSADCGPLSIWAAKIAKTKKLKNFSL